MQVIAPAGCGGCGGDLSGVAGRIGARIQVFDTPPVKLQVTEYQLLAVTCPDCRVVSRAVAPDGVSGPCCYGPSGAAPHPNRHVNVVEVVTRSRAPVGGI